ncbi:MAG: winged helix-turn-helix transcriptional regulator [Nitrospira sp.]|nr:winged helix-turn-helix transcriptional regulator [Nitrospira sp.]
MSEKANTRAKRVRFFRALADEMRVRILERLRSGEQNVCALSAAFQTGQSRLSFHLRVLKDAGLVTHRPEGRSIYYTLNHRAIQEAEASLGHLRKPDVSTSQTGSCADRSYVEAQGHHETIDGLQ